MLLDAAFTATVPTLLPDEVSAYDPPSRLPLARPEVGVQAPRVEVVRVATRATALRTGHARVAVRPVGVDRPVVALEVVGAVGVSSTAARAAALAVGL